MNANKIILLILLFLGAIYGGLWLFNHINAWLGIGTILVVLVGFGNYLVKKLKQTNEKEN